MRARSLIGCWLPVLAWMGLIFSASGDRASFSHSSRIIGPIVRWLFPHVSDEAIHATVVVIRKCAHLTEYAVLALLLWRALRKPGKGDACPWEWPVARLALTLTALYAAADEFHQLFVPTREGSVWDVAIDTVGGALGLLGLWAVVCWWRRRGRGLGEL
ncbi:MAG: VanZ family protein [Verrucomicrobiota bacterium]|nr:VanZ family protein [Verrucomicrobiota bacterium]